jgi:hypothetical protein
MGRGIPGPRLFVWSHALRLFLGELVSTRARLRFTEDCDRPTARVAENRHYLQRFSSNPIDPIHAVKFHSELEHCPYLEAEAPDNVTFSNTHMLPAMSDKCFSPALKEQSKISFPGIPEPEVSEH